jgi:long-subunit fatty acid transport protein
MARSVIAAVAALAAAASIAAAGARPAHASPLFELVGGGRGTGGFNPRVTGAGPSSTYFNPALLAHAEQTFELGVFFLTEQISIDVDARADSPQCESFSAASSSTTCDVPVVFGTGPESFRHGDGSQLANPGLPTEWLENGVEGELEARPRQGDGSGSNSHAYQVIGLVNPIFADRLVLGFYAMIPLSQFTTAKAFYNDEREQFFSNSLHPELYADRLTATSLAFGGGGRITDELSAGLSFTLNLRNKAAAPVYISNLADLNTVLLDSDIGVQASVSPHFGVIYDPIDDLRLAATLHTTQSLEIETGFDYVIATGVEQGTTVSFTHAYMPWTAALAASYDLTGDISLAATTAFARWSNYQDRHSERPHPDYVWRDTISGSAGVRYHRRALHTFLDVAYQPSPVPPQTGRSNYVDNDRVGASTGADYQFALWGGTFQVGVVLQGQWLLSRHVTKFSTPDNPQPNPNQPGFGDNHYPQLVIDEVPDDAVDGVLGDPVPNREGLQTNNPGFPGFGSEGWVLGGALNLAILY